MDNQYKIAIIGGTGKVGRYIAAKAVENGYQVRMLVRNTQKLVHRDDQIEVLEGNIQDIETIRKLLTDCQIVINAFGQPPKEEPLYSIVTERILNVMNDLQISRYIGVTGGSLTIKGDQKSIINQVGTKMFELFFSKMMVDKKKEWDILFNNKRIDWTLIRLPFVVDHTETGYIKESLLDLPGTKITNRDIATFIINQIENQKYVHRAPFISN